MWLYPNTQNPASKCNWVMESLLKGIPGAKMVTKREYTGEPSMFWGFIENNREIIQQHIDEGVTWYFWDMPYFHRYSKFEPDKKFYWRVSKNSIHNTFVNCFHAGEDKTRRQEMGIEAQEPSYHIHGDILIASSSNYITQYLEGISEEEWITKSILRIEPHTNKKIRIRRKPRNQTTSGPDAVGPGPTLQEDLDGVSIVYTLASNVAVDALLARKVVYTGPVSSAVYCSHDPSDSFIKYIDCEDPYPLAVINDHINLLANRQFTHEEIESGVAWQIIKSL